MHAASRKVERIDVARLTASSGFNTKGFLRGYEYPLDAIAKRDAAAFDGSLKTCAEEFAARKKSRLIGDEWGYGKLASPVCFDALGTALCRLATHNGLEVHPPSPDLYPEAFRQRSWQ